MRASAIITLVGITTSDVGLADQLIPTPDDWLTYVVGGHTSELPKLDLHLPHNASAYITEQPTCQTHPGAPSATGYWMYHIERLSGRHCWYLSTTHTGPIHAAARPSLVRNDKAVVLAKTAAAEEPSSTTTTTPEQPTPPGSILITTLSFPVVPRINDPFLDVRPELWMLNTENIHADVVSAPQLKVDVTPPIRVSEGGTTMIVRDTVWSGGQFWAMLVVIQLMVFYMINWFLGKLNIRKLAP